MRLAERLAGVDGGLGRRLRLQTSQVSKVTFPENLEALLCLSGYAVRSLFLTSDFVAYLLLILNLARSQNELPPGIHF